MPAQTITATTDARSLDPASKHLDQLNLEARALISKLDLDLDLDLKITNPDWIGKNLRRSQALASRRLPKSPIVLQT